MDAETLASAVGLSKDASHRWIGPLRAAFDHADISTPQRQAAFLAQLGHESGGFRYVREIWGPTPAQKRYEGRPDLGNTQPGDGYRYLGRGLIQMTGRANYIRLTGRLSPLGAPDFVAEPEALEQPHWAAFSAADYWKDRRLNDLADAGKFKTLTRRINGGLNGYADRLSRFERAARAVGAS